MIVGNVLIKNITNHKIINSAIRTINDNLDKPLIHRLFYCLQNIDIKHYDIKDIAELDKKFSECDAIVFDRDIYVNINVINKMNSKNVAKLLIHELFHIVRNYTNKNVKVWCCDTKFYNKNMIYREELIAHTIESICFRQIIYISESEWIKIKYRVLASYNNYENLQEITDDSIEVPNSRANILKTIKEALFY